MATGVEPGRTSTCSANRTQDWPKTHKKRDISPGFKGDFSVEQTEALRSCTKAKEFNAKITRQRRSEKCMEAFAEVKV